MKQGLQSNLAVATAILAHFGFGASGLIGELPVEIRPDEADIVERAAQMLSTGDLNPRFFHHPAGPHLYIHVALFAAFHAFSGVSQPFGEHFLSARAQYYVLARLAGLAFTTLSVAVIFALGRATFRHQRAAALSAWLAAASPLLIAYSAYARAESSTVLFALISAYHAVQLWTRPAFERLLTSSAFAGLAAGNRYLMAFLVGYIALTPLAVGWLKVFSLRRAAAFALASLVVSLAAFFAGNPFILLEPALVERDLSKQARSTHLGADGLTPLGNFIWYLTNTLPEGMTLPQVGLALTGAASLLAQPNRRGIWLMLLPVGYLATISALSLHWHRWALPALPLLSLVAGRGASWLIDEVVPRVRHKPLLPLVLRATAAAALGWGVATSLTYAVWRSLPSTRQQAGAWMTVNLPAGSKIYQQGYGALVPSGQFELKGLYIRIPSVAELVERGADYVVLSSAIYNRVMAEPNRYPAAVSSTTAFMREAILLHTFRPPRECHIELMVTLCGGPTLHVYQTPRLGSQ